MNRSKLREHIFILTFRIEFNSIEEMPEQIQLYFQDMEQPTEEKDEEMITGKFRKVLDKIPEIDEMINDTQREKDIEFTEEQVDAIRELASEVYGYWEEGYFPDDEWGQIIEEVLAVEEGTVVQLHQAEKLF